MRKVYVIGAENMDIEKIRRIISTPDNVEIICVKNMEEIPLEDRLKSDPSVIHQIHEFKTCPIVPATYSYFGTEKRVKGHERPYKFHR